VLPPDIYFAEGDSPVKAEFVNYPEHYKFSSAIDYADGKGLLDVVLV
jgi:putative transposase